MTRTTRKSTTWKSGNQEVKEETVIQTGRRGRDRHLGQRGCMAKWQLVLDSGGIIGGWQTRQSHICKWIKLGGTNGEENKPYNPGF